MKIIVTGGRNYSDKVKLEKVLNGLLPITEIIQGGANGADKLAIEYAKKCKIPFRTYEAEWNQYGPSAGPRRNRQMIKENRDAVLVAFPGGTGTANCVGQAVEFNLPVFDYRNVLRAITPDIKKEEKMKGLRVFLLAIASACETFAGQVEDQDAKPQSENVTDDKAAKKKAAAEKKAAADKKAADKKAKEEAESAGEEMTEEESPYSGEAEEETTADDDDDFAGMPEEEEEQEEKAPTTEDLRTALVAYATAHGKPKAYEILAKFKGAKKANEVKGADIAKAIKLLEVKKKK